MNDHSVCVCVAQTHEGMIRWMRVLVLALLAKVPFAVSAVKPVVTTRGSGGGVVIVAAPASRVVTRIGGVVTPVAGVVAPIG